MGSKCITSGNFRILVLLSHFGHLVKAASLYVFKKKRWRLFGLPSLSLFRDRSDTLLLYSFPSPEDDFGPVASYDIEPQPLNLTPHSKSSECWARRLEVHLPDPGWQKPARLAIGRSVNQLCRIMLRSLAETSLLIRLCGYSHSNMSSI